jgi:hypothetical protein
MKHQPRDPTPLPKPKLLGRPLDDETAERRATRSSPRSRGRSATHASAPSIRTTRRHPRGPSPEGKNAADKVEIGPNWRIVRCSDGPQWVLEHRVSSRQERDGARWLPRAYCRTRPGLVTALSRLAAADPGLVAQLSERFDGSVSAPCRSLMEQRITTASFDEITTGIAKAREAGLTFLQIRHALERSRRETVRLLGLIGLQDAQSSTDLQRLRNSIADMCGGRRRS